jgi:hypothetical protein
MESELSSVSLSRSSLQKTMKWFFLILQCFAQYFELTR